MKRRGGWFCELWGRAFLHARLEWAGGVDAASDNPYVTIYYQEAVRSLKTVQWQGRS